MTKAISTCLCLAITGLAFHVSSAQSATMAATDMTMCQSGDLRFMPHHQASIERVVIAVPHVADEGVMRCVQSAYRAGYRVYASFIYDNRWSTAQDAAYFAANLPRFAPYLWAVSVGNEQELQRTDLNGNGGTLGGRGVVTWTTQDPFTIWITATKTTTVRVRVWVRMRVRVRVMVPKRRHGHIVYHNVRVKVWHRGHLITKIVRKPVLVVGHKWVNKRVLQWRSKHVTTGTRYSTVVYRPVVHTRPTTNSEDYRADWNAVEPVIANVAPNAIRVFGEMAGEASGITEDAYNAGSRPAGIQAIAFHCYRQENDRIGLYAAPPFAAWAAERGLPLWCSEMTPGTWFTPTDTWASWHAAVADIEHQAPNLQLVSDYKWPYYSNLDAVNYGPPV